MKKYWSKYDVGVLQAMGDSKISEIAIKLGRSKKSVSQKRHKLLQEEKLAQKPKNCAGMLGGFRIKLTPIAREAEFYGKSNHYSDVRAAA